MPWYWTDEIAPVLLADGLIDKNAFRALIDLPVAYRNEVETLEEAARELAEEGEVPLAA